MILNETTIREYLACYGADVEQWPHDAQALGHYARHHVKFAAFFEEELSFERLLNQRFIKPAHMNLAERIINLSFTKVQFQKSGGWLYDIVTAIKPAALAAMLVLGFAIGFGALAPSLQDKNEIFTQQPASDDDGAIL